MSNRNGPIRVLVVEDSPTARNLLVALFNQSGEIQVVGTAQDGMEAIKRAAELQPDVITMDIQLPRINGLEATRQIMQNAPIPIVIVTANLDQPEMDLTFEAMRAGALSVVQKPGRLDEVSCARVVQTVRLMAGVKVVRRWNRGRENPTQNVAPPVPTNATAGQASAPVGPLIRATQVNNRRVVGIASSTGGPGALVNTLKNLPADYPLPVLVVQHITPGFAASLADWLNSELKLKVRLAEQGEALIPGNVYISPDDRHMQVSDQGTILLHTSPPYKGLRPSANYLFFSMARVYGKAAIGVILTGMGDDGVEGLTELYRQGGLVLAQDEATSVVYGMPREAAARRIVDYILPVDQIGSALMQAPEKAV